MRWSILDACNERVDRRFPTSAARHFTRERQEPRDIRHYARTRTNDRNPIPAQPATLAGSTVQTQPNRTGLTVSAAVPVSGVPGLDAVLDVFGGHEAVNATTTTPSAAVTAGFRLSF